jgi:hypothetical protein
MQCRAALYSQKSALVCHPNYIALIRHINGGGACIVPSRLILDATDGPLEALAEADPQLGD